MDKYLMPVRIVASEGVENTELIMQEKPLQANFDAGDCIRINKGGYILLDFGREISGGIALTIQNGEEDFTCAKCRLVFGESVMEALSKIDEKGATNNHSIRDTIIDVGYWSTHKYGSTGFRFVKIEAIDADLLVKSVKAETDIRDLEYKGSFECNDELLNKIWKTAAYTVQLNMHEFIWDGVKRDRLVWIGDMHPEVSAVRCIFGDDECVRRSLDFIRNETPPTEWMNKTASYSMWWIVIQYDLYMHWGNLDYLNDQKEYLKKLCDTTMSFLDRDDLVEGGMESFVDWSSKRTDSEREGRQSIFCMGLERAAKMFDIFGEEEYAGRCRRYVEMLRNEKIEKAANKRMSALTVLSGRNADFAKEVLAGNSAEEMSCFMGYYVLCAKAMLGCHKEALDIIRGFWGGMLEMGATTFWEDFDIAWMENSARIDEITPEGMNDIHGDFGRYCYKGFRHSLCHGWASGPAPFMMEQIGGIEILEPGCSKVKISPNPGDLEWIKIKYPTPYGCIEVEITQENGEIKTDIIAPQEIELVR